MATISAIELISRSMRLAGILESGETPTAEEATDGLGVLNDMLEGWSTESLTVFSTLEQQFSMTANVGTYTIGPAGTFNGTRPIHILSAYTRFPVIGGLDYPLQMIDESRYSQIGLKSQPSQIPLMLFYDASFPQGTIKLWPVPAQATQIFITSEQQFAALANTAATISYPPGYSLALRYALAVMLAAEFGAPIRADVAEIARNSKADIKRANKVPPVAQSDPALMSSAPTSFQNFIAGI